MTKKLATIFLAVAGLLALAGCSNADPLGADFGNAVEHNKAMHIINPSPVYAAPEAPDLNGRRAAGAMQRYEEGTVIQPEDIRTTE